MEEDSSNPATMETPETVMDAAQTAKLKPAGLASAAHPSRKILARNLSPLGVS